MRPCLHQVLVSSQTEMASKSVRRPSALGTSELRRMAAVAARAMSPLGQDGGAPEGLRTSSLRSVGGDPSGDSSVRTRCRFHLILIVPSVVSMFPRG